MKRVLPDHAYGNTPRLSCAWTAAETASQGLQPAIGEIRTGTAVIGGGFTGLSTALHLAEAGQEVVVLEARHPGWGASARNGGFCCLGGSALSHNAIVKRHGREELQQWCQTEIAAIQLVRHLLDRHKIAADTHSKGETILAHSPRAMAALRKEQPALETDYGFNTQLLEQQDLAGAGMNGRFFGALTLPHGFALDPGKYLAGLLRVASEAGAEVFRDSPVQSLTRQGNGFCLQTPMAQIQADKVVIASNGYSSDDLPGWMRGRFMPVQSNVLMTRPLSEAEVQAGWSSDQMAYTHQTLLHYFRLMPDRRFLFGMRGGLCASPRADNALHRRIRRAFERLFPAWAHVDTPHSWNGVLALTPKLAPFVGPVPDMPGLYAGFGYHGNGVAMASHAGALLADLVQRKSPERHYPALMRSDPGRFPLGRYRRALMAPGYALATLAGW